MAILSDIDRVRVWRALMRYWSSIREGCAVSTTDLRAAVNDTDAWIEANQTSFNNSISQPARSNLTAEQKTLLFCAVALMRVDPGVAAFLKRIFGEVD